MQVNEKKLFNAGIKINPLFINFPKNVTDMPDQKKISNNKWLVIFNNILPMLGVIFLGWTSFHLILLYWTEGLIILFFTTLKFFTVVFNQKGVLFQPSENKKAVNPVVAYMIMVFVCGMFLGVQYIFLLLLGAFNSEDINIRHGFFYSLISIKGMIYFIFSTVIVYATTFYSQFLKPKLYKQEGALDKVEMPVGRVMALQFIIVIGYALAFIFISSKEKLVANICIATVLILIKTLFELRRSLQGEKK